MDNLVEQVVKREKNAKYYLNIVLIILGAILIPTTFIVIALLSRRAYFIYIALFLALFCIYGLWYFITALNIEYEYGFLAGTFRVDKIIAKRNRKNILKIDAKAIDDIFKYSDEEMSKRTFNKVYQVGASDYSDDNYVFTFVSEARGKCAVVFSPKEKTLAALRPYLKHEVSKKLY
ncbi:MAG: MFS transporter [Ruminococcaceae bacterium]|nr:MFS transporter [Oscillospiraceae bacterium]